MTDKKSNIKNKNTANTNLKNSEHKIICIDGGGTKTNGALFIGDEIASEYKVGTTRLGAVGQGESCTRTLNVMLELCKRAGITIQDIDICVIGTDCKLQFWVFSMSSQFETFLSIYWTIHLII